MGALLCYRIGAHYLTNLLFCQVVFPDSLSDIHTCYAASRVASSNRGGGRLEQGGITFATQSQQGYCPWRNTHHLWRLPSAMRRQAHLGTRKTHPGGLVMPCVLGLVIALGVGFLAIYVVPWRARCTGATLWPSLHRVRLHTYGAGRPMVRAVGTRADGSPSEEQGHTVQPWYCAHRLRGRFASRPTPCEEGVWEVRTFVCYMPRRSAEERQRLLAAWRDSQHGGAGPAHVQY